MLKHITAIGICVICVWASYSVGVKSVAESRGALVPVESSAASDLLLDQPKVPILVTSDRDRIIGEGVVYELEDLASSRDPVRRMEVLLSLLADSGSEEFGALYNELAGASRYERTLLLNAWLEKSPEDALKFVKIHDPSGLDFAMEVALQRGPEVAEKWADEAGIMTVSLLEFDHQKPSEEEVDQWILLAAEDESEEKPKVAGVPVPLPEPHPEWVKDFPMGESVEDTVAEVVEIAATHSERSRYWLVNSRNRSARLRAAGDIGWESNDLNMDDFETWLQSLPEDLATAALAGRFERLAAENPNDPDLIHEELDSFSQFYNLDESIYLVLWRLVEIKTIEPIIAGDLVARIDSFDVLERAKDLVSSSSGTAAASPYISGTAAAVAHSSPEAAIASSEQVVSGYSMQLREGFFSSESELYFYLSTNQSMSESRLRPEPDITSQ